ncbi:DUF6339 family protein [Lysobacter korlensis]|uniref:DUF6339 family protein n=1 Tax=Lysobacter korlensis TaxID=553636 RepID=A0ABV6RXR6_9GAMM
MSGLFRYLHELDGTQAEQERREQADADLAEPVERNGHPVPVDAIADLMEHLRHEASAERWDTPEASDGWLAPRLHSALRLTRAEAGDRGMWQWVAIRFGWYVEWRWGGGTAPRRDRWFGPVHKQAFARLWWGAELFRDGADYSYVELAFVRQDFPNSYLHRPLVRCRPVALGVLAHLREISEKRPPKASQINDLARVVNLTTAGIPPEAETGYYVDDDDAYASWMEETGVPDGWERMPVGPATGRPDVASGARVAKRAWDIAPTVARARGAKGASAYDVAEAAAL